MFISFSRRKIYDDSPDAYKEAKDLYTNLNKNECKPWMDEKGLKFGEVLAEGIFRAINCSGFIIPIMTGGYATSLWCLRELYYFLLNKPREKILPMLLEGEDVINNETAGKWLMRTGGVRKYFTPTETGDMIEYLKTQVILLLFSSRSLIVILAEEVAHVS